MKSLFNSVLETANLFRKCDKYSQSILQEGDPTNGNA